MEPKESKEFLFRVYPCGAARAADVANTRLARNKNVGVRIYRNILVFKIETKRYDRVAQLY